MKRPELEFTAPVVTAANP